MIAGDELRRPGSGLARLPVPVSTPGFDAAPYLTATLCITRDPDSGVQNMGTYRAALKATDRLAVRMVARPSGGAGGYYHWIKYRERGEPMPIAIVIGSAPVVVFTGPQKLAVDLDELGVAGALAGAPIRTVKAKTVDLMVPADAEIVIEGTIDPQRFEPEAPFGESNGYVALEAFNMPMQVTAITHKQSPVFVSIISQVTPSESSVIKKVAYEPVFLAHLREELSVKGIKRVVMHERLTNLRPVIFLQFVAGTPRSEVWRGLTGTAVFTANTGKIVIAVSEDIDPDSHRRGVLVACLSPEPDRGRAHHALSHRRAGRAVRPQGRGFDAPDRRHAQAANAAAGAARARIHGRRAAPMGGARPAAAHSPCALARLHARRLDRDLGDIRAPGRSRRMGAQRCGFHFAAARRCDARDANLHGSAKMGE